MKIRNVILFFAALITFVPQVYGAPQGVARKIVITATTSDVQLIAKAVGADRVDAAVMIAPTICPSNTDLSPETLKRISKSNIVLSRPYEKWVSSLKYKAVGDTAVLYKTLKTEGNLMIPYINIRAAREFEEIISLLDLSSADYYKDNLAAYAYSVTFKATELQKQFAKYKNVKVVCNNRLQTFLEWLGFNVVAVYGKKEEMSARELTKIHQTIQDEGVTLVVDNLQSGTDIGFMLSEDNKTKYAVISNFPLGGNYLSTLEDNAQKLLKALAQK
jgi:zinc transport system substrate-binding protein